MFQNPDINYAQAGKPLTEGASMFLEQMRQAQQQRIQQQQLALQTQQQAEALRYHRAQEERDNQRLGYEGQRLAADLADKRQEDKRKEYALDVENDKAVQGALAVDDTKGAQRAWALRHPGSQAQFTKKAISKDDQPLPDVKPVAPSGEAAQAQAMAQFRMMPRFSMLPAAPAPTVQDTTAAADEEALHRDQLKAHQGLEADYAKQNWDAQANPEYSRVGPDGAEETYHPMASHEAQKGTSLQDAKELALHARALADKQVEPWKAADIKTVADMLDAGLLVDHAEAVKQINLILTERNKGDRAAVSAAGRAASGAVDDELARARLALATRNTERGEEGTIRSLLNDTLKNFEIPETIQGMRKHVEQTEMLAAKQGLLDNAVRQGIATSLQKGVLSNQDFENTVQNISGLGDRFISWVHRKLSGELGPGEREAFQKGVQELLRIQREKLDSAEGRVRTLFTRLAQVPKYRQYIPIMQAHYDTIFGGAGYQTPTFLSGGGGGGGKKKKPTVVLPPGAPAINGAVAPPSHADSLLNEVER